MATAKTKHFNAIEQPLGKATRYAGQTKATDITFTHSHAQIVIKTKPHSPKEPTDAQRQQHQLWKDADCMWRYMTPGQRALWTRFYQSEKEAGRTISEPKHTNTRRANPIPPKEMGQLQLFMKHALNWDLLTYLTEYLLAQWHLYNLIITNETFTVEIGLLTPAMLEEWLALPEKNPPLAR